MQSTTFQLKPITEKEFFEHWDSKKTNVSLENTEVLNFFKPFVETIPKLVLGEYYWQIFDNAYPLPRIMAIGGAVEKMLPIDANGLFEMLHKDFFSFFHPNDLHHTMTFIKRAFEILFSSDEQKRKYINFIIYTRIKNNEGLYVWNSLQYPALYFDENGNFIYGMALYTNINHLIHENAEPMMTLLDSTNKSKQIFTCYTPTDPIGIQKPYPSLTMREKEIVTLLGQGKASKQIADILNLSKNTVDNHRQRLLKKFGVTSSAELVIKAMFA